MPAGPHPPAAVPLASESLRSQMKRGPQGRARAGRGAVRAALVEDGAERREVGRAGGRGRRAADGAAELEAGLVGEAEDLGDVGSGAREGGLGGGKGDAVDAEGLCFLQSFFWGSG